MGVCAFGCFGSLHFVCRVATQHHVYHMCVRVRVCSFLNARLWLCVSQVFIALLTLKSCFWNGQFYVRYWCVLVSVFVFWFFDFGKWMFALPHGGVFGSVARS